MGNLHFNLARLLPLLLASCAWWAGSVTAAQVNINTADAATLSKELVGIGLKRAISIVEYRQKYGPFKAADELALVKGIGPVAVEKNRDRILVSVPKPVKQLPKLPPAVAPKR